jgi:hypothetical protein
MRERNRSGRQATAIQLISKLTANAGKSARKNTPKIKGKL